MTRRYLLGLFAILAAGLDIAEPAELTARACLAFEGYAEARSEGDAGMRAVMGVAVERSRDPLQRWPRDVCAVVLQPHQFAGVLRWRSLPMPAPADRRAWARAWAIAGDVIDRRRVSLCDRATSFDRGGRARGLVPVCKRGAHTFYIEPPVTGSQRGEIYNAISARTK